MPEVKDRILSAYDSLSKAQKKAADFIISNFDAAAMLSSIKLSLRAGISESTIVRLAYSLGYEGFSDLQKHIQQDYLTSFQSVPQANGPTNEYEDMLASEIRNLQEL
ncbi:MAG: MurR/RpiR family transcriptional regulator, partial [Firmicutes bacterium]|nr:MurR/RpiR family transcriptional regulator [Bacillota bacterium]